MLVILLLVAIGSLVAWQVLGERVRSALSRADQRLNLSLVDGSGSGAPGPGGTSGPGGVGGPGGPGTGSGAGTAPPPGGSGTGGPAPAGSGSGSGTGTTPAVSSGLGAGADQVIANSPQLQQQIQALQNSNWSIQYGQPGKGSFTVPPNQIVIDPAAQSNPALAAQLLAHEVGHANNPVTYVPPSGLTRAQYIQQNTDANMLSEANAVLNNIEARDQILANGGPNIGINGQQNAKYQAVYNDYKAGKITRDQAKQQIAQVWGANETTSNSGQNYQTYYSSIYAKDWDGKYPGKAPGFTAP